MARTEVLEHRQDVSESLVGHARPANLRRVHLHELEIASQNLTSDLGKLPRAERAIPTGVDALAAGHVDIDGSREVVSEVWCVDKRQRHRAIAGPGHTSGRKSVAAPHPELVHECTRPKRD